MEPCWPRHLRGLRNFKGGTWGSQRASHLAAPGICKGCAGCAHGGGVIGPPLLHGGGRDVDLGLGGAGLGEGGEVGLGRTELGRRSHNLITDHRSQITERDGAVDGRGRAPTWQLPVSIGSARAPRPVRKHTARAPSAQRLRVCQLHACCCQLSHWTSKHEQCITLTRRE